MNDVNTFDRRSKGFIELLLSLGAISQATAEEYLIFNYWRSMELNDADGMPI